MTRLRAGLTLAVLVCVAAAPHVAAHSGGTITWRVAIESCDEPCLVVVEGPTQRIPAGEDVELVVRNQSNGTHDLHLGVAGVGTLGQTGALLPDEVATINFHAPESGTLVLWCNEPGHDSEYLELSVIPEPPTHDTGVPLPLPLTLAALLVALRARSS